MSSNWIAACAWRCAQLLRHHRECPGHELDRIAVPISSGIDGLANGPRGCGIVAERGIVEVYPAGALAMWGLSHRGYKRWPNTSAQLARDRREVITTAIEAEAAGWLVLDAAARERLLATDHCLDAFVAALTARAAATNFTLKPTFEQHDTAHAEGWIHLPSADSLRHLAAGGV